MVGVLTDNMGRRIKGDISYFPQVVTVDDPGRILGNKQQDLSLHVLNFGLDPSRSPEHSVKGEGRKLQTRRQFPC